MLRVSRLGIPSLLAGILVATPLSAQNMGSLTWDPGFAFPGTDGPVRAVAVWNGDLYIGGEFTEAGGVPARGLARWDGHTWSEVGGGVSTVAQSAVYTLLSDGDGLLVGGFFTRAGTVSAGNIARWNGASWSPLGSGLGGSVYCLLSRGGTLYAGGNFPSGGGVVARRVAAWDGSAWAALGEGLSTTGDGGVVYALAADDSYLYAGGSFTASGSVPVANVARWDGSAWSGLASGTNTTVRALSAAPGEILVGGEFTLAGSADVPFLARWNGSAWDGAGVGANGPVRSLLRDADTLYVGGEFSWVGGLDAVNIARRVNGVWGTLGVGVSDAVYAMAVGGSGPLYVAGRLGLAGDRIVHNVAAWKSGGWTALGAGIEGPVHAVLRAHGGLYAGGEFTVAGGRLVNSLAFWDGGEWLPLETGIGGRVWALASFGPLLYVGGEFSTAGSQFADNVAVWDGGEWKSLGTGLDGGCFALAVDEAGTVFAGGSFSVAGGVAADHAARWDGVGWSPLGQGFPDPASVRVFVPYQGGIAAGGIFNTAGDADVNNLAIWTGGEWQPLGAGVDGPIRDLAVGGGSLYAVGDFTEAGGVPAGGIARWDGTWHALFGNFAGGSGPAALAADGDTVVVGGDFQEVGGLPVPGLAIWNGASWIDPGQGVEGGILALEVSGSELVVGGSFPRTTSGPGRNLVTGTWSGPVPVRLLRFDAVREEGRAVLTWAVDGIGADLAGFHVHRSGPGSSRVPLTAGLLHGERSYRFVDPAPPDGIVHYWLAELTRGGDLHWHGPATLAPREGGPGGPRLDPNLPNPFRAATTIRFSVSAPGEVELDLFDVAGRRVARLAEGRWGAGEHEVRWDGRDALGRRMPAGVYLYRLRTPAGEAARRLVLLP